MKLGLGHEGLFGEHEPDRRPPVAELLGRQRGLGWDMSRAARAGACP